MSSLRDGSDRECFIKLDEYKILLKGPLLLDALPTVLILLLLLLLDEDEDAVEVALI